jgi:hypothetical protein
MNANRMILQKKKMVCQNKKEIEISKLTKKVEERNQISHSFQSKQ